MTAIAACGLLFSFASVLAQTWTQTSAPINNWNSVASSADGSKLAAAVNGGGIWSSADSGNTWTQTSAPTNVWTSVSSSADGRKLAATFNGGIYTSSDQEALGHQTMRPMHCGLRLHHHRTEIDWLRPLGLGALTLRQTREIRGRKPVLPQIGGFLLLRLRTELVWRQQLGESIRVEYSLRRIPETLGRRLGLRQMFGNLSRHQRMEVNWLRYGTPTEVVEPLTTCSPLRTLEPLGHRTIFPHIGHRSLCRLMVTHR